MIVQEKICEGTHVRVNIFGDAVYACEVETIAPEADLDWRIEFAARWHEHCLPHELQAPDNGSRRSVQPRTGTHRRARCDQSGAMGSPGHTVM